MLSSRTGENRSTATTEQKRRWEKIKFSFFSPSLCSRSNRPSFPPPSHAYKGKKVLLPVVEKGDGKTVYRKSLPKKHPSVFSCLEPDKGRPGRHDLEVLIGRRRFTVSPSFDDRCRGASKKVFLGSGGQWRRRTNGEDETRAQGPGESL